MQRLVSRPALLLFLGLGGCGGQAPGTPPTPTVSLLDAMPRRSGSWFDARPAGVSFERAADGESVVLVHELEPGDWTSTAKGRWQLARPLGYSNGELEVRSSKKVLRFLSVEDQLRLAVATAEPPPRGTTLRVTVPRQGAGEFGGLALPLWPGEELGYALSAGPPRELHFRSLLLGVFGGAKLGEVRLEVEFDGERVGEARLVPGLAPGLTRHSFALPTQAGTLTLRARGAPVPTYLSSPVVAGRERDSSEARPDLILFLADTFRADLLESHGGEPGLVPNLNALAARSLRFSQARSPSTWTLPAHASLFTGLWPGEHGAETPERTFDPALLTLAEALRAAGYRTGAVTQGGYVTRDYALDQGFEYFREQAAGKGPTLAPLLQDAQAFLEADDGRPVFLFVHTYRTHSPYRPDAQESREAYLGLYRRAVEGGFAGQELAELPLEIRQELRALYEAGAHQLDASFGPWFEALEKSGRLARGLFVFTSDHGEAFFEHGRMMHGAAPHEEVARIPLFLFGGGLAPGEVRHGASLVDLYPTLLGHAGLPVPEGLAGQDLRRLDRERTLVAVTRSKQGHFLALIEGACKLHAYHASELELPRDVSGVFDLARDPLERDGGLGQADGEFLRRASEAWRALSRARFTPHPIELDEDKLEELRALGYGD